MRQDQTCSSPNSSSQDTFNSAISETSLPIQLARNHEQRLDCDQNDMSRGKSATVAAHCSSSATPMTRAQVLAQVQPLEDDETNCGDDLRVQHTGIHLQTDDDKPRKRQRLIEIEETNGSRISSSPAPVIKVEGSTSHPLCTLPVSGSSADSKATPKLQQLKKTRPNQRTNNREKLVWSDEETADLIKGVNLVGYGRWRLVLNHPDLKFLQERTSVDLKDRSALLQSSLPLCTTNANFSYRTCLNNGWATNTTRMPKPPRVKRQKSDTSLDLSLPYRSNTPLKTEANDDAAGLNGSAQDGITNPTPHRHSPSMYSPSRMMSDNESKSSIQLPHRKQKQPWTHEEDSLLWTGYKKHGFKWLAIAKDDSLGLSHRRCTAIRDRFRLMLPSLYMDNVKIEKSAEEGGKSKMHWSLRKLVGRDLSGPDPVLLALSEEGPGEEEGEAAFTDQEDEDWEDDDGDEENEGCEEDGDENQGDEIKLGSTELTNSTGIVLNSDEMQHFEGLGYGPDASEFDCSDFEPLIQGFFSDEDLDLGYDEEADEDYFDDGMLEDEDFPAFAIPPEFAEDSPDFSKIWNNNDEEGRDEDSSTGSEDRDEQGESRGLEGYLEDGDRRSKDGHDNEHCDDQVQEAATNGSTAPAPLHWEEMATQPTFKV